MQYWRSPASRLSPKLQHLPSARGSQSKCKAHSLLLKAWRSFMFEHVLLVKKMTNKKLLQQKSKKLYSMCIQGVIRNYFSTSPYIVWFYLRKSCIRILLKSLTFLHQCFTDILNIKSLSTASKCMRTHFSYQKLEILVSKSVARLERKMPHQLWYGMALCHWGACWRV